MPNEEPVLTHNDKVERMAVVINDTFNSLDRSLEQIALAENGTHQFGGGDSHLAESRLLNAFNNFRNSVGQLDQFTKEIDPQEPTSTNVEFHRVISDALRKVAKERTIIRGATVQTPMTE